jgi:hypothetical protein
LFRGGVSFELKPEFMAVVQILIASERGKIAVDLLQNMLSLVRGQGRMRGVIRIMNPLSVAHFRMPE